MMGLNSFGCGWPRRFIAKSPRSEDAKPEKILCNFNKVITAKERKGHRDKNLSRFFFALQDVRITMFREDSATDGHGWTQMEWSF